MPNKFLIFIFFLSINILASGFSKDTVYESQKYYTDSNGITTLTNFNDTTFFINPLTTPLSFDSVKVIIDSIQFHYYEYEFIVNESQIFGDGNTGICANRHPKDIIIKPNTSAIFHNFKIDDCIHCPLNKKLSYLKTNDTMTVLLIFYSDIGQDSLVLIGESTNQGSISIIKRNSKIKMPSSQINSNYGYNIMGQKIHYNIKGLNPITKLSLGIHIQNGNKIMLIGKR